MKFNIKNLLSKKSIKKLEKAAVVGVASLALIIPLGMGSSTNVHAEDWSLDMLEDPGEFMATRSDSLQDIYQHPHLKYTHQAKVFFEESPYWDEYAYDTYAHHFKQLYSPYLYPVMPKRITSNEAAHYKRDEYLLHKGQEQLGLLGHHKRGRRIRHIRHIKHHNNKNKRKRHISKRNRKLIKKNRNKRRNHKARKRITYRF